VIASSRLQHPAAGSSNDGLRTARLLFARELSTGLIDEASLSGPAVRRATTPRPIPSPARRLVDRMRLRSGLATHASAVAGFIRARREVLGARADGPARVLLRVDEFPRAGSFEGQRKSCTAFKRFDAVMEAAGVPYLLAVTPRVAHDVLDPQDREDRALDVEERDVLASLPRERVTFALHGYDHRTRIGNPRARSEFDGLEPAQLHARLTQAHALLASLDINPRVLVPPFNRFEADQLGELGHGYDVICAGPETVSVLGLQPGPSWRGDAVLLPSYPPAYGHAADMLAGVSGLVDGGAGIWIAITLHWGWESDTGLGALTRLVDELAPKVAPWTAFLDEVRWSRAWGDSP
jgi:hypothetical protein